MTTHEQSITMDLQAEIDQLRQENAELNNLASLKLSRSRIKELQADNARLNSEKAEVVRGFDLVQAQYQITKKAIALQGEEIDRLQLINAGFSEMVDRWVEHCPCTCVACEELWSSRPVDALKPIINPVIDLLEKIHQVAYSGQFWTDGKAITEELARLRKLTGDKP